MYVCVHSCVCMCEIVYEELWHIAAQGQRSALCILLSVLISIEHVKRSTFPRPGRLAE